MKNILLLTAAMISSGPASGAPLSDAIHADMPQLMALYCELHAHPELSMQEVWSPALLAPGMLWLVLFYIYPAVQMFIVSLWTGTTEAGYEMTFNFGIYPEALAEYWPWIARSIEYGGLATILAFAANGENRWASITRDSMCWPYGISLAGDRLAVADSGNNRVVIWGKG